VRRPRIDASLARSEDRKNMRTLVRSRYARGWLLAVGAVAISPLGARAQESEAQAAPPVTTAPVATSEPVSASSVDAKTPEDSTERSWTDFVTLSGYAELYYSWNFARPENKVTNNRWLDERHNTFTLQTLALDVSAEHGPVSAKLTLMFGPTADRWYFEGARIPDTETGLVLSPSGYSNETWKHIQSAYAGYRAPLGAGLLIQGGLMPTQVGYEGAAIKDNWNWSRSNLFNFLPFFHVGMRLSYPVTEALTVTAAVYNGWNQASDLNPGKTLSLQASLIEDALLLNLLWLGGPERPENDPTGDGWRNLFDAVMQLDVLPWLSLAANADGGFERTAYGTGSWMAGALYARFKATPWLFFALRGDGIYERVAREGDANAAIFFGGGDHVLSGTTTIEVRPIDGISFRIEYRHDDSDPDVPLYYKRGFTTTADGAPTQNVSRAQNTLTLGLTGWF
jgi:hypothetical protein